MFRKMFAEKKKTDYICNRITTRRADRMDGKGNILRRAYHLYADGFRQMTTGRTLWAVILIKLFIIFAVLKAFFFADFLKANAPEGHEADYVAGEMIERGRTHTTTETIK